MVDTKRYDPTITRFQRHTKNFVSGKTKKGHLNKEDRDTGDVVTEEGILVRIDKDNIQGKTWEVKVDNKTYMCSYYGNSFLFLPNCTESGGYYLPKKECRVEVSIDKKSKIYTITKIKGMKLSSNEQLISIIENDKINIQGSKNTSVSVGKDEVSIQGSGDASVSIKEGTTSISGKGLSVDGDVQINTSKDNDLPDNISVTDLYKRIQVLEEKLDSSDNDDS